MGTHPIFESDFDCLTELSIMSGYTVELGEADEEWQDVILPSGALKSGKLTGLIGFQEFVPKNAPKKRSSSAKKRKKAEILFGDKVQDDVAKVAVATKIRKKDASRPKKKQKKSKGEDFSLTEEDKAVSTEDYKFKHELSGWKRFNLDKRLLRGIDTLGLECPTEIQRRSIPAGINSKST